MIENDMNKPLLLYRYRKWESYNLKALKNGYINGTLYKEFENSGELNLGISNTVMNKLGMTNEERDNLLNKMVTHCNNNYYLASFTKNEVSYSSPEWEKYADTNGYCLVYLTKTIENEIIKSINQDKMIEIKKVHYSNESFYIDKFIKALYKNANTLETQSKNGFDNWVYDRKLGKHVVKAFAHKSKEYKPFNEYRLVRIKNQNDELTPFLDCLLPVKPIAIIVRKDLDFTRKIELQEIARVNGMSFKEI